MNLLTLLFGVGRRRAKPAPDTPEPILRLSDDADDDEPKRQAPRYESHERNISPIRDRDSNSVVYAKVKGRR